LGKGGTVWGVLKPMANETNATDAPASSWRPALVYGMAAACLAVGLLAGYLVRGSGSTQLASAIPVPSPAAVGGLGQHPTPTLEQMKQMADKQAQPLLEQLKTDGNNKDVLMHVAYLYKSAHQFKEAADYFEKALQQDPKNVAARTEMASCLYYNGDVDGALGQLQQALKYDPKDANSLFNLGIVKWKGKNDPAGAIAAWQRLLATNPKLDRKPIVERMMAEARQQGSAK
jgi:cytochrome c-type biogenesis protein CcmH/NrfG